MIFTCFKDWIEKYAWLASSNEFWSLLFIGGEEFTITWTQLKLPAKCVYKKIVY